MKKYMKYSVLLGSVIVVLMSFSACEKFLNPEQELKITEDKLLDDYYEYRSLEMGLYGLQQELVEQIILLGELRGDLLTVTPNASAEMIEINDFNISKTNKYADPTGFFKLIASSNNFIRLLKINHPEVLDPASEVTNYDRMYGEALCMRAWAYFEAVRIYGKVPLLYESLTTIDEINDYVNSPGTYVDSVYISYSRDGYYNDTIYNKPVELQKQFYTTDMVIDIFADQLENEIKAVGVNHYIDNNDNSWEITVWNPWARHALLGLMYLTRGDLARAENHFREITMNTTEDLRYQLDKTFSNSQWKNIFVNISNIEHIYVIPFSKGEQQQNKLQEFFEPFGPHRYQLKPTGQAIKKWETVFRGQQMDRNDDQPWRSKMIVPGKPGDWYRGAGTSYAYFKGNEILDPEEVNRMLVLKAGGDTRSAGDIMEGYDTMVYKYSIEKDIYDEDADFILFRAGGIQLYRAEVYANYFYNSGGVVKPYTQYSLNILNDGSNYSTDSDRDQKGVRGRVGLGGRNDKVVISNIEYIHDPYTNEITGYKDISNNFTAKQNLLEDKIMDERARELAFEGERFYDLMRIAKRRDDPSYLAEKVSQKFPQGKRQQIYNLLLDENNWYIHFFD